MSTVKKYKINSRIREIIEREKGEKSSLSHNQIEQMVLRSFKDKFNNPDLTDEDKRKIKSFLIDFSPNQHEDEELNNFAKFLPFVFDDKEIVEFIMDVTNKYYHPGKVVNHLKVYHKSILYFISLFLNYFNLYKGIVINDTFIGDVKKIYPDVKFDENTGEITDENVKEKMDDFIDNLKIKFENIKISIKDNIYVICTEKENEDFTNEINNYGLVIEDIPNFYFLWNN